jgi:formylglycine-generating enzyme required for sulfatase activity
VIVRLKSRICEKHAFAVLLISQDFVNSNFIRQYELPWIRQGLDRNELGLIRILVGPVLEDELDWLADRQIIENSIGMKLALIPAGQSLMGSPDSDVAALPREKPQHAVTITLPFYLGVYPVTQEE